MKARSAGSMQTIDDAMADVVEFHSRQDLMAHLSKEFDFWGPTDANVTCEPYGFDKRVGWNTHLLCVDGKAALFTDGPIPPIGQP